MMNNVKKTVQSVIIYTDSVNWAKSLHIVFSDFTRDHKLMSRREAETGASGK